MTNIEEEGLDPFYVQALLLAKVITRILELRGDITLSSRPELVLKPITEFRKRMRVTSYEKFDSTTYIATINFYLSEKDLKENKTIGAVILYISEEFIGGLLKKLGYPIDEEDDQEAWEDACGTLCNLIAGKFNAGLTQLGYQELVMSHFSTFRNDIVDGVAFDPAQKEKYEVSFHIKGQKQMMADLTMGTIPRLDA